TLREHGVTDVVGDISSRVRRRERAERGVPGRAGHEAAGYRQSVPGRQDRVDPRERAEPLARSQLRFGTAGHVGGQVVVLRGLLEEDAAPLERAAEFEVRLEP